MLATAPRTNIKSLQNKEYFIFYIYIESQFKGEKKPQIHLDKGAQRGTKVTQLRLKGGGASMLITAAFQAGSQERTALPWTRELKAGGDELVRRRMSAARD